MFCAVGLSNGYWLDRHFYSAANSAPAEPTESSAAGRCWSAAGTWSRPLVAAVRMIQASSSFSAGAKRTNWSYYVFRQVSGRLAAASCATGVVQQRLRWPAGLARWRLCCCAVGRQDHCP